MSTMTSSSQDNPAPADDDAVLPAICVLAFNANDPCGAGGLAADIAAVASVGGHPAPVVTGAYIRDSAEIHVFRRDELMIEPRGCERPAIAPGKDAVGDEVQVVEATEQGAGSGDLLRDQKRGEIGADGAATHPPGQHLLAGYRKRGHPPLHSRAG